MANVIWHWTRGNINIFTRRIDIANKAKLEGRFVVALENKSHIYGSYHH